MYYFFRYRMDVSRVAEAILMDEIGRIDVAERMVIENRLYQHISGKKPIKGDEWLNEELKKDKPKRRRKASR